MIAESLLVDEILFAVDYIIKGTIPLNPTQAAQPKGSLYILCFIFQQVPRKFSHLTLALSTFCITFGTSGFPIPHNFTQFNLLDIHVKYLSCAPFQFWKEEVNGGGEEKGDRRQGSGFSQCIEGQTDRSREQGLELVEIKWNGFLVGIAVISIPPLAWLSAWLQYYCFFYMKKRWMGGGRAGAPGHWQESRSREKNQE